MSFVRGKNAARAYAPGRVELLGNHTDYNGGLVLAAAIDRGVTISGAICEGAINVRSTLRGSVELQSSHIQPQAGRSRWANYLLGVAAQLSAQGIPIRGFCLEIESNLPPGHGLASSAAVEVATAFVLLKLHRAELEPMQIAKLCQNAEHSFVGVQCGLLDQVTCVFGKFHHLIFFDARSEEVRAIPFPPDLAFVVAESDTNRELVASKYNQRRVQTSAAAQALHVRALRDVCPGDLEGSSALGDTLRRRAMHIVAENERVQIALDALAADDTAKLGELMNASHESSRLNFENSTPQLDWLVNLARTLPGVLGARLTGAGFGGSIVALCQRDQADNIAARLRDGLITVGAGVPAVFVCQAAGGARLLDGRKGNYDLQ